MRVQMLQQLLARRRRRAWPMRLPLTRRLPWRLMKMVLLRLQKEQCYLWDLSSSLSIDTAACACRCCGCFW
jgi:hypothetical protein